jgi:UDP-N-acetylglucosamine/UDP-N-acetylgalactosamine diphosphorylase
VTLDIPQPLREALRVSEQQHVLAFWDRLNATSRAELIAQLQSLDFEQLRSLFAKRNQASALPANDRIEPIEFIPLDSPQNSHAQKLGEEALRAGQVAALVVAGGQGSRLGFEHPKGMYPVGPVSRKSLFQIHAEKILALSRRYGKPLAFLLMTSPATHAETVQFFDTHKNFGLAAEQIHYFSQGTMPALDLTTGKLLLEEPGRLFLSPDGHGGTLTALASSGLLARLQAQGVRSVFYFQVDNPMVNIAEPLFLGHHLAARAEVSSKVVAKAHAGEKVGVLAKINGRCGIVEYSDLPASMASEVDATGRLRMWAGNPAIHIFDVAFLDKMTREPEYLAFHIAKKKVPCIDANGAKVEPTTENALKFERFIFDVLPAADRYTIVEALRSEEFAPLKNAEGADSPATVDRALTDQALRWLTLAKGSAKEGVKLEVSPLFALDAQEFLTKVAPNTTITENHYFGG